MRAGAALAVLLFRHWARASLPNRLRRDKGRRVSAGIFRFGYLAMMGVWGYTVGRLLAALEPEERLRGGGCLIIGMVGLAVTWTALTRGPSLRGDPSPLEASFLEVLPLRQEVRVAVGMLERLFIYAFSTSAFVGVAPRAPLRAVAVAFALSTAAILSGEALMRLARVLVAAMTIARVRAYTIAVSQTFFMLCIVQAPVIGRSQRFGHLLEGAPSYVARALLLGDGLRVVLGISALVALVALASIGVAERIGYDRIDLVPGASRGRSAMDRLVLARIDDLLRRREPGGRWSTVFMMVNTTVITGLCVAFAWSTKRHDPRVDMPDVLTKSACYVAAFSGFVIATSRASRMATRDVAARPLLAPLPVEPRDLLAGRAGRLRASALLAAIPAVALLATPWSLERHLEIAWRVGSVLIAVALAATAATSIAFLTVGAGSKRIGGSFALESVLVLAPLVGVVTAQYAWAVIIPLVALGLVAREANKSGLACVRWLDDDEEFERETPIWRALLVLAAFSSAQTLGARIVGVSDLDEGLKATFAYAASCVVLVGLTLHGRRDAPRLAIVPARRFGAAWLALGVLGGLLTGLVGLVWGRVLERFGIASPVAGDATSKIAMALATVGLAPIAEELFFRGWLFPSIEHELAARGGRWLALLVGAFAFAAVHPPLAFVPVFALGLVASALFAKTRALGPSIAAHLCHNAVAVLVLPGLLGRGS
jgi:membrane protease YdiL (CAAX protease family)